MTDRLNDGKCTGVDAESDKWGNKWGWNHEMPLITQYKDNLVFLDDLEVEHFV